MRVLARATRYLIVPAILGVVVYTMADETLRAAVGAFLVGHLGFIWWGVLVVAAVGVRAYEADQRKKVLYTPTKTKRKTQKPLMQSGFKAFGDWVDLLIFRDAKPWRVAYALATAATAAILTVQAWDTSDWPFVQPADPAQVDATHMTVSLVAPAVWLGLVVLRVQNVSGKRAAVIEGIHGIAKATLTSYPKPSMRMQAEQMRLLNPYTAIAVREWETLDKPRTFFVAAPSEMSVSDGKSWNEFEINLAAKVPHPEGWHVERERNGRGALVSPAKYPASLIWDGEQDADPLTFIVGADLDDPEVPLTFTLGETSPHILVTGGTGSGKTSLAEAIMAQAATKPMPWDPSLVATCHVIDPKGPFANRWQGRPQMDVTNGTRDVDIEGETESGIVAMGYHMERILLAMNARQAVLDQFGDIATWLHLPDGMKQKHAMAPVIIVMDEYLDHVGAAPGSSEAIQKDNAARERIQYIVGLIARKGRSLGFHLILIAQDATMTVVGGALIRQLVARAVLGNMDHHAYGRMFGNDAMIPVLPNTRIVKGKEKTIPGRGRLMNAPGQPLRRMQVFWFGGSDNSETLNKYLPRHLADVAAVEDTADAVAVAAIDDAPDLTDADGNGIPDAWERAGDDLAEAQIADALADPESDPLSGHGAGPVEPASASSGPDSWAMSAPAAGADEPEAWAPTEDDLMAIIKEAEGEDVAPPGDPDSDPEGTPAAPAFTPRRGGPDASSPPVDPDDDPVDPEPADPDSYDDSVMRVVGPESAAGVSPAPPGVQRIFNPLVANPDDLVEPGDIFGRR